MAAYAKLRGWTPNETSAAAAHGRRAATTREQRHDRQPLESIGFPRRRPRALRVWGTYEPPHRLHVLGSL